MASDKVILWGLEEILLIFPQNIMQNISRGKYVNPGYLKDMLHKRIIRETIHRSKEFVSPILVVKKPDGGT